MFKQQYVQNNLSRIAGLILLWGFALPAFSLSTDEKQPIEIEADMGELDDLNNVSIYRGNVIAVQGSIRMTGDKMTVYFNDDSDMEILIMEGRPATYRQLPDNSEVYDEAEAQIMEYYELRNLIILKKDGVVTQATSNFSGECIEYDTILSKVKAWSVTCEDRDKGISDPSKKERVRIIIKPNE